MGHIFISYSHKDKDYVHRLQDALQNEGFEVWIDDRIDYGTRWPRVIQDQLDACDAFIVVVSDNSLESEWVQNEVARAGRKKKPFFPLLLQGDPWLSVEATQYADVTDGSLPNERIYKRLSSVTLRNRTIFTSKKPAPKFDFRLLGIGGIIVIVLILGVYGINYIMHLPPPPGIGSTMTSPKDGMKLLYVPTGNFLMGSTNSDPYATADEKPQHTVYLDAFWIDQTDVTNVMYAKCVSAGACNQPTNLSSNIRSGYYGNSQYDNYPVSYVDWNMADKYCKWAGRQLPTEAQWEKAARGTDGRIYPWGNNPLNADYLNYNSIDPTAVDDHPNGASPYHVLDMAGNVFQWVNDWYSDTYYQSSPASNPKGPVSYQYRVQRGNDWETRCRCPLRRLLRGHSVDFQSGHWFSLCH